MGLLLIMALILGSQLLRGHTFPPTKQIVTVLACFVVAVAVHEFMHAFVALKLGDNTAERQGRLTFNPIVHFEPFGFIGMVLISLGYSFIGWGKPVPVTVSRLQGSSIEQKQRSMAIVAVAGPVSNVIMSAIAAAAMHLMDGTGAQTGDVYYVISWFFYVNTLLAAFNAIPIPPLDGYRILIGILPSFWTPILAPIERYGFLVLIFLFFIGGRIGGSITSSMIQPIQTLLFRMLP